MERNEEGPAGDCDNSLMGTKRGVLWQVEQVGCWKWGIIIRLCSVIDWLSSFSFCTLFSFQICFSVFLFLLPVGYDEDTPLI